MREMMAHTAGRVFVAVLALSVIGVIAAIAAGALEAPAEGSPAVWFGWVTAPLALGIVFVLVWLVAYLVYFTRFWPFR